MINELLLTYIDDKPDALLSDFLNKRYTTFRNISINYEIFRFKNDDTYEKLFENSRIIESHIILIDSRLFENRQNGLNKKYTGEEFKTIARKIIPYVDVLVITQNDIDQNSNTIKKYCYNAKKCHLEYYEENLKPLLDSLCKDIITLRQGVKSLSETKNIDEFLFQKIESSLDKGEDTYDSLKKSDIDDIIKEFQKIEKLIEKNGL